MQSRRFRKLALGGTFDILHKGHEDVLLEAFNLSDKVLLGLSTDSLAKKLGKTHRLETYEIRRANLERFLREKGLQNRVEVIPINNRLGVAHQVEDLEILMSSRENTPVASEVNRIRRSKGLTELKIFIVEKTLAQDGMPISSTRMRRGEIDRYGRSSTR